jgi:hypothetical protein
MVTCRSKPDTQGLTFHATFAGLLKDKNLSRRLQQEVQDSLKGELVAVSNSE